MRIEESVAIERPIDEVFPYVGDPDKHAEWVTGIRQSTKTSSGPLGVGATYRQETNSLSGKCLNTRSATA